MVKTELYKDNDQPKQSALTEPATRLPLRSSMFQTKPNLIPHRTIDPNAIDISSIKGRFAWEKIALGDTYIPVIFRNATKYFCVRMLHKLLPGYPEDFIRRSSSYEYRKPIDLYIATSNELALLNKINIHHCHGDYSRSTFTVADQLVRVSDFLPFYEHLRLYDKSPSISRTLSVGSLKPVPPSSQKPLTKPPSAFVPVALHKGNLDNPSIPSAITSTQKKSFPISQFASGDGLPAQPSIISAPPPARLPKSNSRPVEPSQKVVQQPSPSLPTKQSSAKPSKTASNSAGTELCNTFLSVPTAPPPSDRVSLAGLSPMYLTPPKSVTPSPIPVNSGISPAPSENSLVSLSKSTPSSSSISRPKSPSFRSGWLQINKLYTPYLATNFSSHHLYKIPVSLLTFYDLLRTPSLENNSNESRDSSFPFEKTLATSEEIKQINDLCLKQNIKPFSIDTELINLETFYHYSSASVLFVKELPPENPKAYICKDWTSIIRTKGGICLLRHRKTLHEQTVAFIEDNILKDFTLSSENFASASLTIPTAAELEFLQLVLFVSNITMNLHSAKLIDLQSVQKEYYVDVMLLFNDKFPLNVLDYHHQGNRSTTTQAQISRSNSTSTAVTTTTFVQSTPPPSPVSPATNSIPNNPPAQLSLNSPSNSSNRYQKTIIFHGQSITAYICSGLGTSAQRECVSVRALCDVLYPNSSILDKLELRLLRLLRVKNINRFRPQNQQTIGLTRLVDVKDVEEHWDYIQREMSSLSDNEAEKNVTLGVKLTKSGQESVASLRDDGEKICGNVERSISMEVSPNEKRPIEREMEKESEGKKEGPPPSEGLAKRIRVSNDCDDQSKITPPILTRADLDRRFSFRDESANDDDMEDENPLTRRQNSTTSVKGLAKTRNKKTKKKSIHRSNERLSRKSTMLARSVSVQTAKKKIKIVRKRRTPRVRTHQQSVAAWIRKYGIEDCCVRLDLYRPVADIGRH